MTTAALAARCLAELGPIEGALVVDGTGALARALVMASAAAGVTAGAAVVFVGERGDVPVRRARLMELRDRLPIGAPLIAVDHNQPRTWWRRWLGYVTLALRGLPPARARYSVGADLQAAGFAVERLRLVAGERIQLVVGRCADVTSPR